MPTLHIRALLRALGVVVAIVPVACLAACGSGGGSGSQSAPTASSTAITSKTVTLVAYDSFALSKSTLEAFTARTGVKVKVLRNGDTGKLVNTAILTKNRPQGDVLFGVDNTFLSKALDANLFEPYTSPQLGVVDPVYDLDPQHRVTPVDHGDVCVDYDKRWFAARGLTPPASFEDLTKPAFKDLLVVENPATSAPGLSFLLASVAHFGGATPTDSSAWTTYWQQLRANGVKVESGWDDAYYQDFTAGSDKGTRPVVVSYATDPAAAVDFATKKTAQTPIAVVGSTCFGTVEFAGVMRGAKHADAARALVDFMLGAQLQADIPPNLYVYPVRRGVPLPPSFTKYAPEPAHSLTLDPQTIGANREQWTRMWQRTVLG